MSSNEINELFGALFPRLADLRPQRIKDFRKVRRVLAEFARRLGKKVQELNFFGDFLTNGGEVNDKLLRFVSRYHRKNSTRVSESSRLEKLIKDELELAIASGEVTTELASVGLVDAEKLPSHLKKIWEVLPRIGGAGQSLMRRLRLPLTPMAHELFKILIYVNNLYSIEDLKELLQERRCEVSSMIRNAVGYKLRYRAQRIFVEVRRRFNLISKKSRKFTEKDLPMKLQEALCLFRARAPHGFQPYPELQSQAHKYKKRGGGVLSEQTILQYADLFIARLSRLNLKKNTCLEDLLVLRTRSVIRRGKVVALEYFNPIIEPYLKAQRAASNLNYKAETFDSVSFRLFLNALFAIARYNGEFDLPIHFQKHIKLRLDRETGKNRKHDKKKKLNRVWVDAEIQRLKGEFNLIVRRKTFLKNKRDLELCLFLVQLVVMRYLGFRQQCLRRCIIGKNIIFNEDGSITFFYERNEIKNGVRINQTFSRELCDEIPEIVLLIDLLTDYYEKVLPAIRSAAPKLYDEKMGNMFFALPSMRRQAGLIRKPPVWAGSATSRDAKGKDGAREFNGWFQRAAYKLMKFEEIVDCSHTFNPHLLRGHCCDWLRKDKEWSWESISKVMGDTEATLKREYFDEEEREQNSAPYVEYNKKLKNEREQKERIANSVPLEALNQMQAALGYVTTQFTEERELRKKAEKDAATYKLHYEFVLSVANITDTEVKSRLQEELVPA
jgi:hypothetical protein